MDFIFLCAGALMFAALLGMVAGCARLGARP
jgi:hypothetical protein